MGLLKNIFKRTQAEQPAKFNNSLGESWLESQWKRPLVNNTAETLIKDTHLYRGYGYGIIRSIVNSGINAAEENIRTTCSQEEREILAEGDTEIVHPYIKLWKESPYFSEYDFWKKYLTYIQLTGRWYIYMNRKPLAGAKRYRAGTKNLMTNTDYMKIINPFEMQPKSWDENGDVTEWLRTIKNPHKGGKDHQQVIPAYQIIEVKELDPWHEEKGFSLLNAAKDNLITLENAKDYTRHALVGNVNAPGLLSVDGEFQSQEEFDNYVSMLKHHDEGELIIAAGNAKASYQSMNQNLDGASQEKIRDIERDEMLVTSGVSKSVLGIETSGLTRDVAATQKLTFIERTVVPYIRLLLEALNYDYRKNYVGSFNVDHYMMHVTVPSIGDKVQEMKELEIREEEYNMVQKYIDRGFTARSAAQYVRGEIDVEQLQLNGREQVKMSPDESVKLVDATERWAELISAGNDPDSTIDLVEGRISIADFLEKNRDILTKPAADETTEPIESEGDDTELKKPLDYYDPDPDDYSTPRDEKETPADKTKKEKKSEDSSDDDEDKKKKRNDIALAVIKREMSVDDDKAKEILETGKMSRSLRCHIQNEIEKS